jgi:hypothetical protein
MIIPGTQANDHALGVSWSCFYPKILECMLGLQSEAWFRYRLSRTDRD